MNSRPPPALEVRMEIVAGSQSTADNRSPVVGHTPAATQVAALRTPQRWCSSLPRGPQHGPEENPCPLWWHESTFSVASANMVSENVKSVVAPDVAHVPPAGATRSVQRTASSSTGELVVTVDDFRTRHRARMVRAFP